MNEQEIILAKICAILDKRFFLLKKNGEIKKYMKCCGLGKYYDENEEYFEPFWYNGTWENPRQQYNLFIGLDNVFTSLLKVGDTKGLSLLLVELGKNISSRIFYEIEENEVYATYLEELQALYQLIGYDLTLDDNSFDVVPFSGNKEKIVELYGLEQWLKNMYEEIYDSYEGIINAYSSGIEACRTTLTGIFLNIKALNRLLNGFVGQLQLQEI